MILLDTHIWIWWINGSPQLPQKLMKTIKTSMKKNDIYISTMSTWEISMLVKMDRLQLRIPLKEWLETCESMPYINFVSVSNKIALESVNLPGTFHKDPADRIIVATSRIMKMPLATQDKKIIEYQHAETI
jgi:PIN domain nuclease of toxin-antitoxin system